MLPNLIHWAIPFFVAAIGLEVLITARRGADFYEARDALSSVAMGLGNVLIGLLGKGLVLAAYVGVYQWHFFEIGYQWWAWGLLFLGQDLSYYWFHRCSHNIRFLWASHVIHHSSQRYNLSTALRQTWTGTLTGSFVFYLWLPLLGFPPVMVLFMQSISLLYQFWIHTETIGKLPRWVEWIFNTPSHHRVHHGADNKYLDRNHGGILIIWDRLFGSFQPEEERPTYGLTENIHSYNPFWIAIHEWVQIARDMWRWPGHALRYLLGPPGWSHDGSRKTTRQLREQGPAVKAGGRRQQDARSGQV